MDDEISMENMKNAYNIVEDAIEDLNNKAYQLITIIGVMFTLQVSLLSQKCVGLSKIFLIFSLICYALSSILFIKSSFVKGYQVYPTNESVKYHYEEDVPMEEYYSGAIGDYYEVISYNRDFIDKRSYDMKFGFYFFIFGLILTLMTIIFVVMWMNEKKKIENKSIPKKMLKPDHKAQFIVKSVKKERGE